MLNINEGEKKLERKKLKETGKGGVNHCGKNRENK